MLIDANTVDLLCQVDLFSSLAKPEMTGLARIATLQKHPTGKIVFHSNEKSEGLHVVILGKFDSFLWDDLFKIERPLISFTRGEAFGEVGLLTDAVGSAFVRAQEESETIFFEKEPFLAFLEKKPKILLAFARVLARRSIAASKYAGVKYTQLSAYKISRELALLLPLQVVLRHRVIPIEGADKAVTVAIVDPADQLARNTVTQYLTGKKVSWAIVSSNDFDTFRDQKLFDLVNSGEGMTAPVEEEIQYMTSRSGTLIDATSEAAVALDSLLRAAIDAGASDLHLEPGPKNVAVRARIDGRLIQLAPAMGFDDYRPIVSRIKVLAEMDIVDTRLPQDAAMRVVYGTRNIDLRISTVPAAQGEAVACRLFDPMRRTLDFTHLIASDMVAKAVHNLFMMPSGLLLVTGPTGSGKTTTLYTGLRMRQSEMPTTKMVTAEDPVEYELAGVTQVQLNLAIGLTYERILRSLLRQEPEVILVGEIRDSTSMDIAIEGRAHRPFRPLQPSHERRIRNSFPFASARRRTLHDRFGSARRDQPAIASAPLQRLCPGERSFSGTDGRIGPCWNYRRREFSRERAAHQRLYSLQNERLQRAHCPLRSSCHDARTARRNRAGCEPWRTRKGRTVRQFCEYAPLRGVSF
jgi:CRP-like cAMP-binding protein/energy-coupling factor transporter ATP-binding protein EcfA2